MLRAAAFIEPCLPSPADKPPSGSNWIHEIKHDGYRLMARRDPVGIRLLTRNGNDWSARFPLVVEAVNHLNVRSCLIDGEVVCCDERGLAIFSTLRRRRNEARAFLFAFDLLEMDGRACKLSCQVSCPGADTFVFDGTAFTPAQSGSAFFDRILDYDQGTGTFNPSEGDALDLSALLSTAYNHGNGQSVDNLIRVLARTIHSGGHRAPEINFDANPLCAEPMFAMRCAQ